MGLNFICEATEKGTIKLNMTNIFTFIGVVFCVLVAVIAIVWLTCFMVRLLIKTFSVQIKNSYDVFVENNTAKAESKKARNAIKRKAADEQKLEITNMKLESKKRIYDMKKEKLAKNLLEKEEKAKEKYEIAEETKTEEKTSKQAEKQEENTEDKTI